MQKKNNIITVQDIPITVTTQNENDYISITDIASAKTGKVRAADVIKNWLRNRTTLEFLGTWEQIYNDSFKVVEFEHFKREAEAIRTIFDRYVNTEMGANGVAKYLENHGIKMIPRANMKNDYNDRLYKIYDKIEELENLLSETRKKKRSIENDKVTADNVYKTLG